MIIAFDALAVVDPNAFIQGMSLFGLMIGWMGAMCAPAFTVMDWIADTVSSFKYDAVEIVEEEDIREDTMEIPSKLPHWLTWEEVLRQRMIEEQQRVEVYRPETGPIRINMILAQGPSNPYLGAR